MLARERVGDHELRPQQPDAVDGHGRHLVGVVGDGEVDVEQRSRCLCRGAAARALATGTASGTAVVAGAVTSAPARTTPFAPSTVTTSPSRRTVVALRVPTMVGEMELAPHDRGMAGDATAVGHESGRATHRRDPVRVGHRRHQHLAPEEPGPVRRAVQDADRARGDAGRGAHPAHQHATHPVSLGRGGLPLEGGDRADCTIHTRPAASANSASWGDP